MNKTIYLTSALLLFSNCVHKPQVQRPFSTSTVTLQRAENVSPITIEQVNTGEDTVHRARAKELGISYVDYLHMVNNGKISATKSEPVIYHKHR